LIPKSIIGISGHNSSIRQICHLHRALLWTTFCLINLRAHIHTMRY
jgi:hypothetical protein